MASFDTQDVTRRSGPLRLGIVAVLLTVVTADVRAQPTKDDAGPRAVTFYAMGDVPYAPEEDELLPRQVAKLPNDGDFVVHVGDIKRGNTACDEAVYVKVAGMLGKATVPVFVIPGDNEWNDCAEPDRAWTFWERHFLGFDRRWRHELAVVRLREHEEFFSFLDDGVLFVGLNIVGGQVRDAAEWRERHARGVDWIRRRLEAEEGRVRCLVVFGHARPVEVHEDFSSAFSKVATAFDKPVLYLHGDGHKWMHDRPFAAKNILRVQIDQGGIAPPLKVTVTDHATQPFEFDRRNGKPAK